mmetsp:Transcript_65945/g.169729  ORF Transcript_65945/g.169729 Transcript_65945/m.169729 type:complete len:237 (+) Transcript_65945:411-1121(+)
MASFARPANQWLPRSLRLAPFTSTTLSESSASVLARSRLSPSGHTVTRFRRFAADLSSRARRKASALRIVSSAPKERHRWMWYLPDLAASTSMKRFARARRSRCISSSVVKRGSMRPRCRRKAPMPKGKKRKWSTPSLSLASTTLVMICPIAVRYFFSSRVPLYVGGPVASVVPSHQLLKFTQRSFEASGLTASSSAKSGQSAASTDSPMFTAAACATKNSDRGFLPPLMNSQFRS